MLSYLRVESAREVRTGMKVQGQQDAAGQGVWSRREIGDGERVEEKKNWENLVAKKEDEKEKETGAEIRQSGLNEKGYDQEWRKRDQGDDTVQKEGNGRVEREGVVSEIHSGLVIKEYDRERCLRGDSSSHHRSANAATAATAATNVAAAAAVAADDDDGEDSKRIVSLEKMSLVEHCHWAGKLIGMGKEEDAQPHIRYDPL